jgi:putative membrane protein
MSLLVHIALVSLALLLVSEALPGIALDNMYVAVVAAIVLGALHLFVRPVLVLLTLPVTILTLGLFLFVINAALFLAAAALVDGFYVSGFIPALLGALVVSVAGMIADALD